MKHQDLEKHVEHLRRAIISLLDLADYQYENNVKWELVRPALKMAVDLQKQIDALILQK